MEVIEEHHNNKKINMSIFLGVSRLTGQAGSGSGTGGGGLLSSIKYSTPRSSSDTDVRSPSFYNAGGISINTTFGANLTPGFLQFVIANGQTTLEAGTVQISGFQFLPEGGTTLTPNSLDIPENFFAGESISISGNTSNAIVTTILSHPALSYAGVSNAVPLTLTFASSFLSTDDTNSGSTPLQFLLRTRVNPATDLSLSDGDLLGYFMVGAGDTGITNNSQTSTVYGGHGGRILQGTTIIETAATDLTLTVGVGVNGTNMTGGNSTITGGLTLSTLDGSQIAGHRGTAYSSNLLGIGASSAGNGINGYGAGDGGTRATATSDSGILQADKHGFGMGAQGSGQSGDGCIILIF